MADEKTATALEIEDIFVSSGDKFVITGVEDGGESTAEHGRIDRVKFVPIIDALCSKETGLPSNAPHVGN